MKSHYLIPIAACLLAGVAHAKLVLNPLIGDNAVLQRNAPIPVWGEADPKAEVSAEMAGKTLTAKADADGDWLIEFPAMPAGGPYELTVRSGDDTLIASRLLVGDVWVCTGQSNMYWPVNRTTGHEQAVKSANNDQLRLFTVQRTAADEPVESVQGAWLPANPYTVGGFSAVGYYFGSSLQPEAGVPVGLIMSTVGGTLASNWTSREVLEANPASVPQFERYERELAQYPADLAAYEKAVKKNPKAQKPREPAKRQPSGYYNGMIAPLFQYPVAGIIWYQGESDSWNFENYDRFLHDMIDNWRRGWEQPELPFLIVQLAGFEGKKGVDENYPEIREVQRRTGMEPNNGLALAIDVGEADDIHPANKKPVGERLAKVALAQVYGQDVAYAGPTPQRVYKQGADVVVEFDSGAGKVIDRDGGDLPGFELAGADQQFYPATARLDGNTVILSSAKVSQPVTVRYAWTGFPKVDLYNEADLPATPFKESITTRNHETM
ncbi:sialate O-acetylesterase [Cerasicoccus fimbriatus]|uniref:sialate O-acetylesterase n=1 Tax=Cerasicoccus fimbriatus TaxID=3014554 RepID=UPI0022B359D5|nr:sialate O-acetylesterase [Cerasicoccus sp. TK19100]